MRSSFPLGLAIGLFVNEEYLRCRIRRTAKNGLLLAAKRKADAAA